MLIGFGSINVYNSVQNYNFNVTLTVNGVVLQNLSYAGTAGGGQSSGNANGVIFNQSWKFVAEKGKEYKVTTNFSGGYGTRWCNGYIIY